MQNLKPKNYNLKPASRGFTLVETIVAIAILVLAIGAPLTIAYQGITFTSFSRDQVIATYLAQDAIEAIITQKRQNVLTGAGNWLDNMTGCGSGNCDVDSLQIGNPSFLRQCGSIDDCQLRQKPDGTYSHDSSGILTKFTRTVKFEDASGNSDEQKVTVTVTWHSSIPGIKSFSLQTNIFNTQL